MLGEFSIPGVEPGEAAVSVGLVGPQGETGVIIGGLDTSPQSL